MVLNRIEQKKRDAAEKRQQDELAQRQAEANARQEQLRKQAEAQRSAETRLQLVRTNSQYVLDASGVLKGLKDIENGRLTNNVRKHALVIDLDTGTAQLAWGNKFKVENNRISYSRGFLSGEEADYQSINQCKC